MSSSYNVFFTITVVLLALCSLVQTLPRCEENDEDCHDRRMHPDLPNVVGTSKLRSMQTDKESNSDYWRNQGKEFIRQKLSAQPNTKRAKNVILFLGDGMGLTTLAATRNIIGGEAQSLYFEKFPHVGLSKTYAVDTIVPDSACTSTAYLCGVKAIMGTIGVNGMVDYGNCHTMKDTANHVYSFAKWAMDAGKSAGLVTTTRVTHASPAGVYAHIANRDWENDSEVNDDCGTNSGVQDIADQLIHGEVGRKLKLIMGGGKSQFIDAKLFERGYRRDGRNLIKEFQEQSSKNLYLETREQLMSANLTSAERVLGIYQNSHMLYHLETNETTNQPTLEEMTRKAIEYLRSNEEGYFIFIEGGRIDLAHHDNMARIALDETAEFSKAVQAARELTSEEDTLIVVTADHSHSFTFAGYPQRGNDIFGKAPAQADDSIPYLTLSYANGPSYEKFYNTKQHKRRDPTTVLTGEAHDMFPSTFGLETETHGGDDVPVFASGPWSHLFTGVYEQNTLPHMMGYASCLGAGIKSCDS